MDRSRSSEGNLLREKTGEWTKGNDLTLDLQLRRKKGGEKTGFQKSSPASGNKAVHGSDYQKKKKRDPLRDGERKVQRDERGKGIMLNFRKQAQVKIKRGVKTSKKKLTEGTLDVEAGDCRGEESTKATTVKVLTKKGVKKMPRIEERRRKES